MTDYGYWIMSAAGVLIAVSVFFGISLKNRTDIKDSFLSLPIASLSGLLFAKILGVISFGIYNLKTKTDASVLTVIRDGGFVFYGGMIGFFAVLILLKRYLPRQNTNLFAVCFPLFHSFARIGCYFAGCCYGKTINGVKIPVQLIESILLMLLFVCLLCLYLKGNRQIAKKYFLFYAIIRFFTEFLRGDEIRGVIILSFSQWISLAIVLIVLCGFFNSRE